MINRDSWGASYSGARGEILGFDWRLPNAKALHQDVFIDQERKLGDRRRSDTVVVLTINYADQGSSDSSHGWLHSAPCEKSEVFGFWGEYGRKAET